jgi:hypothetical protein
MRRRTVVGLALSGLAATTGRVFAQDQKPLDRRWAALSLIGDALTIVTYVPKVGSSVDTNRRATLPLSDPTFDKDAIGAVANAVSAAVPDASVSLLLATSPSHYERQADLVRSDTARIAPDLVDAVRATAATHLVLVSKHRAEARLKLDGGTVGSGSLEGLGFYVDRTYETQRADHGESDIGFLAPYAYLNVSIVEAATLRLITGLPVKASTVLSPVRNMETVLNPWEALSSAEKVQMLRDMVRHEVSTAVTKAIQSVPARP